MDPADLISLRLPKRLIHTLDYIETKNAGLKMLKGLRTVVYGVNNLEKAKEWYTEALGVFPYFDQPFYAGFNVGGYELGLDPNASPMNAANTGS